jgi:hypothetical protein
MQGAPIYLVEDILELKLLALPKFSSALFSSPSSSSPQPSYLTIVHALKKCCRDFFKKNCQYFQKKVGQKFSEKVGSAFFKKLNQH